jgi:hypothetical protein
MNRSNVSMMDLPDEMILTIWNKLNKLDVLYSFLGVNKRFNKLVHDIVYTRSIELIKSNSKNNNCSLTGPILDRFCLHILPRIHELVECLTLESISMERILSAGVYPRLRKLTLVRVEHEFVSQHFTSMKVCLMFHFDNSVNLFRRVTFCSHVQKADLSLNDLDQ